MATLNITAGNNTTIEKQGENLVINSTDTVTEIENEYSERTDATYGCDYVNNFTNVENLTIPTITQALTYSASDSYFKKYGKILNR